MVLSTVNACQIILKIGLTILSNPVRSNTQLNLIDPILGSWRGFRQMVDHTMYALIHYKLSQNSQLAIICIFAFNIICLTAKYILINLLMQSMDRRMTSYPYNKSLLIFFILYPSGFLEPIFKYPQGEKQSQFYCFDLISLIIHVYFNVYAPLL